MVKILLYKFLTTFHNKNKISKKIAKFYKKGFGNFFGIGHFCFSKNVHF